MDVNIVVIIMIAGVTSLGPSAGGPWGVADHADSELRLSAGTRTYCQCGCSKLANDDRSYHVDSLATVTQADDHHDRDTQAGRGGGSDGGQAPGRP